MLVLVLVLVLVVWSGIRVRGGEGVGIGGLVSRVCFVVYWPCCSCQKKGQMILIIDIEILINEDDVKIFFIAI